MKSIAIIGGGAAGFFAAITIAEARPDFKVTIYEKSSSVLGKVKISGGGRCNVTHHCFDPRELVKYYPRGQKAMIGPFTKFGPSETVSWFESRDVELKTESDGRMFPITNDSATIVNCLVNTAIASGVEIKTKLGILNFNPVDDGKSGWNLFLNDESSIHADVLVLTTGSSELIWHKIAELGIDIESPVPSLFTFNIKDSRLKDLLGISFPMVRVKIPELKLEANGPLLITHWGLSGPGILKISSWGAVELNKLNYKFKLKLNFFPDENSESIFNLLTEIKSTHLRKQVNTFSPFDTIPKRFWVRLVEASGIKPEFNWADLSKTHLRNLSMELTDGVYEVNGKSTFKDEFVTSGGVKLSELDLKTMSSKKYKNLFFAGEIINVDAVTGGFNFQNAWTTGWIAGEAIQNAEFRM